MSQSQESANSESDYIKYYELDPKGDVVLVFNRSSPKDCYSVDINLVNDEVQKQGIKRQHTPDIRVRVSSKHLTLGSPVFEALLAGSFREGNTLRTDGEVEITLEDDPFDGMMVLLKLLHFKFDEIEMTPLLLMQIALLADKYDMATPLRYWSYSWCDEIYESIPFEWRPDVISYMGMFSMLKLDDFKTDMMDLARAHMTEAIPEQNLPIQHLIGKQSARFDIIVSYKDID